MSSNVFFALTRGLVLSLSVAAVPSPVLAEDALDSNQAGLDAESVFAILAGELAGRRGEFAAAHQYYQQAADLTRHAELAELAVRSAMGGGDTAGAMRAARVWLDLAPDSPDAHQVSALLHIKTEDREGALRHLRRIVELGADDAERAWIRVSAIVARMPDAHDRIAIMRALIEQCPQSAAAEQALATIAAAAEEYATADAAARRALELRPDWNKARLFRVRLLLSQERRDEARSLLESFVSASPEDGALRMLYGQFLVEEQDFTSAREVFERVLSHEPRQPDVLFAIGVLSLQLEDFDGARSAFTQLHELGQRRDEAAYYLGQVEEQSGNDAAAIEWYQQVHDANASDAQIRVALLEARGGHIERAREIVQRLRDQSPDEGVVLYLIEAEILTDAGHAAQAMPVYDEGLEHYPDDPDLLYARALLAVELDQIEAAERDLRQIIAADPQHADALNALGYTLADRTERYAEARNYIEQAYALKPDEPAVLDSMGWVYFRLGEHERALGYLRRALELFDDGEIAAHLGEVLWVMGREAEARTVWEAALAAHPEHAYLHRVVERYHLSQSASERPHADSGDSLHD